LQTGQVSTACHRVATARDAHLVRWSRTSAQACARSLVRRGIGETIRHLGADRAILVHGACPVKDLLCVTGACCAPISTVGRHFGEDALCILTQDGRGAPGDKGASPSRRVTLAQKTCDVWKTTAPMVRPVSSSGVRHSGIMERSCCFSPVMCLVSISPICGSHIPQKD
jgi:hypothetical protein